LVHSQSKHRPGANATAAEKPVNPAPELGVAENYPDESGANKHAPNAEAAAAAYRNEK
jgi:hypothetical protein